MLSYVPNPEAATGFAPDRWIVLVGRLASPEQMASRGYAMPRAKVERVEREGLPYVAALYGPDGGWLTANEYNTFRGASAGVRELVDDAFGMAERQGALKAEVLVRITPTGIGYAPIHRIPPGRTRWVRRSFR